MFYFEDVDGKAIYVEKKYVISFQHFDIKNMPEKMRKGILKNAQSKVRLKYDSVASGRYGMDNNSYNIKIDNTMIYSCETPYELNKRFNLKGNK